MVTKVAEEGGGILPPFYLTSCSGMQEIIFEGKKEMKDSMVYVI